MLTSQRLSSRAGGARSTFPLKKSSVTENEEGRTSSDIPIPFSQDISSAEKNVDHGAVAAAKLGPSSGNDRASRQDLSG